MSKVFNIVFTTLHLVGMYLIMTITLLSNNENVLFWILIIMLAIKFSFYLFKRCIVTCLEDGNVYPSAVQMTGYILTTKHIEESMCEEIVINFSILLIVNKLLLLLSLKHYHNLLNPFIKNLIYTPIYNDSKL